MKTKKFHFLTNTTAINSDNANGAGRVQVPRTIRLGEQEFSIADNPELASLVALVRQDSSAVEKAKLYPAIEKLRKDAELLANAEIVNPAGNAGGTPQELVSGLTEAKVTAIMESFMKKFEPLLESNLRSETANVEAYKNKLIEENVGKCIPELVVGTTKEEIDLALATSLDLFGKYKGQFGVKTIEEQMAAMPVTVPVNVTSQSTPQTPPVIPATLIVTAPVVPQAPATTPPQTFVLPSSPVSTEIPSTETPNISAMSMEEFAKRRNELTENLKSLV